MVFVINHFMSESMKCLGGFVVFDSITFARCVEASDNLALSQLIVYTVVFSVYEFLIHKKCETNGNDGNYIRCCLT